MYEPIYTFNLNNNYRKDTERSGGLKKMRRSQVTMAAVWVIGFLALAALPTPASAAALFQADCWIDDDLDFDWGQTNAGRVYGTSTFQLRADCQLAAQAQFGAQGSSDIRDIVPVPGSARQVQARCWLDDDTDFDWGQYDAGNLIGTSTYELRQECQLLAQSRYGNNGSSGLRDIVLIEATESPSLLRAQCWLDDDVDFDEGQTDAGVIYGRSTSELRMDCQLAAQEEFGAVGTSGIKDVQAVPGPARTVQARCWIDDDLDFDWGQYDAGNLFGNSTYELRQECRMVAQSRYGANGTSGLKEVLLLP